MNLFTKREDKTKQKERVEQLAMPMKRSSSEVVYGIKRNVDKRITYAGVIPYWRSFFFVAAFVSSIVTLILISYILYNYYAVLPNALPLYYIQASQSWMTFSKPTVIVIPFIVLLFTIFSTILNAKIYHFDRRLVLMLNIAIIMANIFLVVGLAQIISLLLVY